MKKLMLYSFLLILLGCGINTNSERKDLSKKSSKGMTRDEYMNSLDSAELMNGLVFWTSDTAFSTNADLLLLLDTLYQHVRAAGFPSGVKKEEIWMYSYRSRLVSYYDTHSHGNDILTQYAKVDSVLNEGVRLLELGCNWSTMEMIVNNSTKFTFDRCKEYGLLIQLINNCESDETKEVALGTGI